MKTIKMRSDCPVSYTLDILGDKWTLLILRDLVFNEKSSYGEFLESEEKIATNILADRLSLLESNGFIIKTVSPHNKSKFIYTATEKTADIIPLLMEMVIWASKYNPAVAPKKLLSELAKNKAKTTKFFYQKIMGKFEALSSQTIV